MTGAQAPGSQAPDWDGLYHSVLAQVLAHAEASVASAFAAQATEYGLPLPPAVEAALREAAPRAEAEPIRSGNAALDLLNAHFAAASDETGATPTPPWLQPFTRPEKVRFTRTPDPVLRWERALPTPAELAAKADEASRLAAEEATRVAQEELLRRQAADPAVPAWRRPFVAPPNVRYTRTPDPRPQALTSTQDVTAAQETVSVETVGTVAHDQPMHAVTVTTTVTTVESTTVSAFQPQGFGAPAEVAPMYRPQVTELPAWLNFVQPMAPVAPPAEQDNGSEPGTLFEDADSEGSSVFARSFGFEEPVAEVTPVPTPAAEVDPDSEGSGALFRRGFMDDEETTQAATIEPVAIQLPAEFRPERAAPRAFGSHGMPGFEGGALYASGDFDGYQHPSIELLAPPIKLDGLAVTRETLEQNARLLEGVLEDFGIRGEIIAVRPGPVVTLYELEPAPGVKSSRVVNLADDIARSMSAVSARVAVVQGRNVIGIELPNERRETVFLRELIGAGGFGQATHKLAIALGKTIGGESVIVDLARMPHLLVAGTTGSGKSVAINTMILSLLYRMRPDECRLIMVDPKMLELSIYDGIPHLLTPVVTDSKKAVIALKWAVREMEDRYKKMAKVGVRNIDGFNARVAEAKLRGETITRTVQQGFDRETGEAVYETEAMDLAKLPYIVIIVDEMADLMMVAGKEIEGAIQRLAQMARAAGIHLIMATQRPSVDVITGTIKANFPTRISFQVTSKIDSRTILGEQGAEQLLGQGDMLHMAGGGRIVRVHGPFVSDGEVEKVVWHLKTQGHPEYLDVVTADESEVAEDDDMGSDAAVFDKGSFGEEGGDLYDQAVKIVLRDKKCSTSYVQRRLQIGYNKAASIVERMEKEGLVGPANPTGKREILNFSRDHARVIFMPGADD